MKFSEMFPSRYLKAADLNGRPTRAIIERIVEEDVVGQGKKEDHKPVIFFRNRKKGLVLNKTNGHVIASKYGDDAADSIGKEIELYPDTTPFQGRIVDCIRVRIPDVPDEIDVDADVTW